jgi:hypothetical protein
MADAPTADPDVVIEAKRSGYVRYRNTRTGRRWEVSGTCDRRGDCLIGAVIPGFGQITSYGDIEAAKQQLGVKRLVSEMDVPVTPEFVDTCCAAAGLLTFREI